MGVSWLLEGCVLLSELFQLIGVVAIKLSAFRSTSLSYTAPGKRMTDNYHISW